jgi:hypothetical protein
LRIEAVTVCVDYADFLEVTLPSILAAVDELVVVTSPNDRRTKELCAARGVRTCVTTAMYQHGHRFSLGAAIDAGLRDLRLDDWVLVVDADIVLPRAVHRTLQYLRLDPYCIHGIDRVHCRGHAAWSSYLTTVRPQRVWEVPLLRDFPMGTRIQIPGDGYAPCGYFQLWNAAATGYRDYPVDERGTAEGSDMMHASRFPRPFRTLIPDLVCVQLETDAPTDPIGVNWAGRRTPEFSIEGGPYRR